MCLRYTLKALAPAAFNEALAEAAEAYEWQARYNVALTNRMPVITWRTKPTLETMQFGLALPARAPGGRPLLAGNARAETMLAKPGFRDAARHRRCLIPADGFYEWEKAGTTRRPHYFSLRSGAPFFFAGLWEPARDDLPVAFCIVTTTPNTLLQPIHHRMPVMLGPNSGPAWLGDEPLDPVQLTRLCRPLPAGLMTGYRVDPRVNSVRYEAPDCVAAV
jgi:putative SOS response-associated peptidase YedK